MCKSTSKNKEESKHIYRLELTERQAKILSYVCDQFSRLICGQDWSYQELFEAAWEKRCKEATGNMMDKEWDGGWNNMRADAEAICKQIKKRFWGVRQTQCTELNMTIQPTFSLTYIKF